LYDLTLRPSQYCAGSPRRWWTCRAILDWGCDS